MDDDIGVVKRCIDAETVVCVILKNTEMFIASYVLIIYYFYYLKVRWKKRLFVCGGTYWGTNKQKIGMKSRNPIKIDKQI